MQEKFYPLRKVFSTYASAVLIGVALFIVLYIISTQNYPFFHTIAELFTIIIATTIFFIIWNSYKRLDNHYFIIVAVGYFFAAALDLLHLATYRGVQILQLNGAESNIATQTWLAARFLQAIALFVAPQFITRKAKPWIVVTIYLIVALFLVLSIFYWNIFPVAYITGKGLTFFKYYSEYAISLILLLSMIQIIRKRRKINPTVLRLLIWSMFITILSELTLTLYANTFEFYNFLGHFLKIIAFYLIYRAIVVTALKNPEELLFRNLKQSEQAVIKSREQIRRQALELQREKDEDEALLSSIGDSIVAIDLKGNILYVNRAFEQLVGVKSQKLSGKSANSIIPLFDKEGCPIDNKSYPLGAVLSRTKKIFNPIKSDDAFFFIKNRRKVALLITATPIISDGKMIGAIAIYRDVTREKEIERIRNEFISFAAHELRTPLTTLNLTLEMMLKDLTEKSDSESVEYIADMMGDTAEMAKTIEAFLNVSRIEMGTFPINPKPGDLIKAINSSINEQSAILHEKGLKIKRIYPKSTPILDFDSDIIKIVLNSILSNAVKHTPEKGYIVVGAIVERKDIIIYVTDTGSGIPTEEHGKVFDKMFRAKNVGENHGVGLGLYIVRMLIRQAGGDIWFESPPANNSVGTTFFISFPKSGMKQSAGCLPDHSS